MNRGDESNRDLTPPGVDLTTLQRELRDNERKALTVLETIADSVITIDIAGVVQSFNPAAEREFGYASDEVIGQNVRMLMPGDMAVQHDGFIGNYLNTGDSKIIGVGRELTAQRKDRSLFDIELAIGEMEVAGDRMFTGVIRNITDRKRAEAELNNSLAELQRSNANLIALQRALTDNERKAVTVLETIADSVIVIDVGGIVQSFNPAAEKEFGYSSGEVIGQNIRMLMLGDMASRHDGFIRNYLNTGESKIIGIGRELIAKRKDGSTFDIELAIGEMEISGDRMFTGVIRNISERKQAEIEAANFVKNLKQSNEELERFASIASHDLQEPLRKVQAFGDRLQKRFHDVLDDTGRDYIARMLGSTSRMQTLISDLLSISRVATQAREFVPVDLNEVVEIVLYDLETSIADSGATVSTGELPVIDADPVQMRQLLQNLIGNALKYHKPDVKPEVQVSAHLLDEADEKSNWSSLPQVNRRCEISVSDNGIGFGAEYADQIFDIFQRLHGRDTYSGTGVGLAICKKIVERHGGTIRGIGEEEKGATFIATLPISQNQGKGRTRNEEWISNDISR